MLSILVDWGGWKTKLKHVLPVVHKGFVVAPEDGGVQNKKVATRLVPVKDGPPLLVVEVLPQAEPLQPVKKLDGLHYVFRARRLVEGRHKVLHVRHVPAELCVRVVADVALADRQLVRPVLVNDFPPVPRGQRGTTGRVAGPKKPDHFYPMRSICVSHLFLNMTRPLCGQLCY